MHIPMDKLNYGISYFQHVINMMQIVNLIIIGKQDLWTWMLIIKKKQWAENIDFFIEDLK
jgi:hypothetical protein